MRGELIPEHHFTQVLPEPPTLFEAYPGHDLVLKIKTDREYPGHDIVLHVYKKNQNGLLEMSRPA